MSFSDAVKDKPFVSLVPDFWLFAPIWMKGDSVNVEEKSIDTSTTSGYMSAGNDRSAGLFSKEQIGSICPKCKRKATEERIAQCQDPDCPYTYLDKIVGEPELEDKKNKEEEPR